MNWRSVRDTCAQRSAFIRDGGPTGQSHEAGGFRPSETMEWQWRALSVDRAVVRLHDDRPLVGGGAGSPEGSVAFGTFLKSARRALTNFRSPFQPRWV